MKTDPTPEAFAIQQAANQQVMQTAMVRKASEMQVAAAQMLSDPVPPPPPPPEGMGLKVDKQA